MANTKITKVVRGIHTGDAANSAVRAALTAVSVEVCGKIEKADLEKSMVFFGRKCPYTGEDIDDLIAKGDYAVDHIIPQNRCNCGLNTIGNLVIVKKEANQKKSGKTVEEFLNPSNSFFAGVDADVLAARLKKIKEYQAKYYVSFNGVNLSDEMEDLYKSIQKLIDEKVKSIENKSKVSVSCSGKVGEIVKNDVFEMLRSGFVPDSEICKLMDKDYSKKTFGLKYPMLSNNRLLAERYYATPVELPDGSNCYVTNDWYEKNKEKLVRWISNYKKE